MLQRLLLRFSQEYAKYKFLVTILLSTLTIRVDVYEPCGSIDYLNGSSCFLVSYNRVFILFSVVIKKKSLF